MVKFSKKAQKKFLIDPELLDKLKEKRDLLNNQRDLREQNKLTDTDILESALIVFLDLPNEFLEKAFLYRDYKMAEEEIQRLRELKADQVPELIEKALSLLSEES